MPHTLAALATLTIGLPLSRFTSQLLRQSRPYVFSLNRLFTQQRFQSGLSVANRKQMALTDARVRPRQSRPALSVCQGFCGRLFEQVYQGHCRPALCVKTVRQIKQSHPPTGRKTPVQVCQNGWHDRLSAQSRCVVKRPKSARIGPGRDGLLTGGEAISYTGGLIEHPGCIHHSAVLGPAAVITRVLSSFHFLRSM
jgi:hypothetical protein